MKPGPKRGPRSETTQKIRIMDCMYGTIEGSPAEIVDQMHKTVQQRFGVRFPSNKQYVEYEALAVQEMTGVKVSTRSFYEFLKGLEQAEILTIEPTKDPQS
jgi:hypothetical protein